MTQNFILLWISLYIDNYQFILRVSNPVSLMYVSDIIRRVKAQPILTHIFRDDFRDLLLSSC